MVDKRELQLLVESGWEQSQANNHAGKEKESKLYSALSQSNYLHRSRMQVSHLAQLSK